MSISHEILSNGKEPTAAFRFLLRHSTLFRMVERVRAIECPYERVLDKIFHACQPE